MNREERERVVDGALARALRPENAEPRDGFEDRLLANLAAQPQRRPWWRWLWVPALAAAAVLAVMLAMRTTRRPEPAVDAHRTTPSPEQPVIVAKTPVQSPQVVRRKAIHRTQAHVQLAHATAPTLPKQEVFPTPVPMTDQERLLLALVRRHPLRAQEIAAGQEADRQQIQKYLESIDASEQPATAQPMR